MVPKGGLGASCAEGGEELRGKYIQEVWKLVTTYPVAGNRELQCVGTFAGVGTVRLHRRPQGQGPCTVG